jgi:hypothetical protein
MVLQKVTSIPTSSTFPFPINIFLLKDFKDLVEGFVSNTEIGKKFKPRLYSYADFVIVKLYAMIKGWSTHCAAEYLNQYASRRIEQHIGKDLKIFADKVRKRRIIPHQTDVDNFFSKLSEKDVQFIFRNALMALNRKIKNSKIGGARMHFIIDNTKYANYCSNLSAYDIGSNGLKGTKHCRMFQAYMLHGCGMSLFTEFQLLKKGEYRGKHIGAAVDWIKCNGFKISDALIDREFYRVMILRTLRYRGVRAVLPAKKFKQVQQELSNYLLNKRPITQPYLFSQSMNQYPLQGNIQVQLSLVGHNNLTADDVKNEFWSGKITFDEAMNNLAGFLTTLIPWKNTEAFCSWLKRLYKKRWNIETDFREVNAVHESYRNHSPITQLAQLYLRGYIVNYWQACKKEAKRLNIRSASSSLREFLRHFSYIIAKDFIQDRLNHVIIELRNKKEVYFN